MQLTLQLYLAHRWQDAAVLEFPELDRGTRGRVRLGYLQDHALEWMFRDDEHACSLTLPVELMMKHQAPRWLGFLEDIMPAGASRRYWVEHLGLQDVPVGQQDMVLLRCGTIALVGAAPGTHLNHFTVIRRLVELLDAQYRVVELGERFDREAFVIEWVKRDLLNVAFGNSDNHGRNAALLKRPEGIWHSPVFDFAPMKADPEGVTRTTRWGSPFEEGGEFDWHAISEALADLASPARMLDELMATAARLVGLKDRLQDRGVPERILTMPAVGLRALDDRLGRWRLA